MSLASNQLDAFFEVAKKRSFSAAAQHLGVTQSALSQRISNLENELGSSVFVRESSGIRLTALGEQLLRYCQSKTALEGEFLASLQSKNKNELAGIVRIGAFSSVLRSVILPSLGSFLTNHSAVQVEFFTKEFHELPKLLEGAQADFIFLGSPLEKQNVHCQLLGYEENVLVKPKNKKFREDVFLDHDPEDRTTEDFFRVQKKAPRKWQRSYFDEIYTIIDGVIAGVGRAVVPLHLAQNISALLVDAEFKPVKSPVYFCYYEQPFFTKLQKQIISHITQNAGKFLKT